MSICLLPTRLGAPWCQGPVCIPYPQTLWQYLALIWFSIETGEWISELIRIQAEWVQRQLCMLKSCITLSIYRYSSQKHYQLRIIYSIIIYIRVTFPIAGKEQPFLLPLQPNHPQLHLSPEEERHSELPTTEPSGKAQFLNSLGSAVDKWIL